jgi:hypothetical protein
MVGECFTLFISRRAAQSRMGCLKMAGWWFTKRTNKGTEAMTYDEVRLAFLDAGRRRSELAWLKAEVTRIRDLSQRNNSYASPRPRTELDDGDDHELDLLSARYDVGTAQEPRPIGVRRPERRPKPGCSAAKAH